MIIRICIDERALNLQYLGVGLLPHTMFPFGRA
jgi:hypothetical protein